uniref:Phospholipid scramblase n=1 Tax=Pipistrellus kuhlii TaxID=59472 RepID=A0A7J7S6H1_PIPKU|nr:phospholipid scramblase 4 [Pipistrellus kuhlii]
MSGVGPTAPEQPTDETGSQVKSTDPRPAVPPGYDSHVVPGPPGAYVPPPAGYPGGMPMGYYGPQQPGAFPFGQPPSSTHPIQYQPGRYPVSSQSAPVIWMPGPTPMPDCPPGLECLTQLEVQCPPGRTLGFVRDHWNMCQVAYSIQNEKKEKVLSIRGPCSTCGCGSDSVFQVRGIDGVSSAGSVVRKWHGLMSAMGQADHYDVHFPLDLDVRMKAMIFGACFLIDFMYYERSPQQDRRTR